MEDKLRAYMDHLFKDVKQTRKSVELKEEILQNLVDKYRDLLAEGKTQEAAYNISVAGIGDMEELLTELKMEEPIMEDFGIDEVKREKARRKSALLISVAVMLYITCILPPLLMGGSLAPALMFVMIAVATGLIIYNHLSRPVYRKGEESIVDEFKEWKLETDEERRALKSICSALWALIVVIYVLVSFQTMAWYITWVIFLIGLALEQIIKAVFELRK